MAESKQSPDTSSGGGSPLAAGAAPKTFRVAVMLSGRGSNFNALVNSVTPADSIEFVCALTDNPHAAGLTFAEQHRIPVSIVTRRPKEISVEEFNEQLAAALEKTKPDLIVLAGFMRILTAEFFARFRGKVINIHPSLLPAFKGLHAQRQALAAGAKVSGCTVHVATEELDSGPTIAQAEVAVLDGDTVESLSERILAEEHRLLPAVIKAIARSEIRIIVQPDNSIRVLRPD